MPSLQQSFNFELKQIIADYGLKTDKIAVAVSGGADSLALVLLLKGFVDENSGELAVLTVNHHLRPESTDEADYVAELMKKHNIRHSILDWQHSDINKGIETKARQARYRLLLDWCRNNDFNLLMTAHHLKDQAETFLIRLQRGSGVDGLAAISKVSEREGVKIVRPLLNFMPEELRKFLTYRQIKWCEDSSNQCDDFLRVRIRKILPLLEKELGLTCQRIGMAATAISSAKDYFAWQSREFIANFCRSWYGIAWSVSPERIANQPDEIAIRVLAELLKKVGQRDYAPEYEALHKLIKKISASDFSGCTLGNCEILLFQSKIWIVPETSEPKVLSKKEWSEYVKLHPDIPLQGLPYKLKLNMVRKSVEFKK